MKRKLLHIGVVFMIALCALPAVAQLNGTGYYIVRNAQYDNHYISIANDKLVYSKIVSSGGGATKLAENTSTYAPYAFNCVDAYLRNDIHLNTTEYRDPAQIVYLKKGSDANSYNIIGQGTSILALTTGMYDGTNGDIFFKDLWVKIRSASGSGVNTLYTASIQLKARVVAYTFLGPISTNTNMGTRYFTENSQGKFAISESSDADSAKWKVEKITYFNVPPPYVEHNGKYYTTLKVPFECTVGNNVEKAYVIHAVNNKSLDYEEITGTIPAGTAVMLQCSSNSPTECTMNLPANHQASPPVCALDTGYYAKSAPPADEKDYYVEAGNTNLLKGTYYCNTDGNVPYVNYQNTTQNLSGNHYTTYNKTVPTTVTQQKYILGICESGNLGFIPATSTNPSPSGILPANKAWTEVPGEFTEVAMPEFSLATNTYYENPLSVTISCATPGATIYYTTATGSNTPATPTSSSTQYTGPITVNKAKTTIKAIAILGDGKSAVASATYTIQVKTPTVSPAAGSYVGPQTVTANCATEGATIRYTTNGSNPASSSPIFPASGITVDHDMTVKVRAFKTNWTASAITTAAYTITNITANPTSLTINDSGQDNTFEVTGTHLNSDNVGVTTTNDFKPFLTPTTGTATNNTSSWYFTPSDGALNGTVAVTYEGRKLGEEGTINIANNQISTTVNVTYVPDIYIVTDNGVTNQWDFNGAMMTNNNGVYTATFNAPADNTFILFARKASLGDNERWGTRYVFGPNSGGDWVMPSNVATANGTIDVNDNDPIKLPYAGEYTITINTNDSNYPFTITRTIETVATPTISPATGDYTSPQSVTIDCTTPGVTIHYTTDGSEPTTDSPVYSSAIPVNETTTIKAIAVKPGWNNSAVAEATYNILITTVTTLAQLEQPVGGGTLNNHYAVSDELIGTWSSGNILWAKDYNSYSEYQPNDTRAACQTGQIDYLREIPTHYGNEEFFWQSRDWDESNWIALDFSQISGTSTSSCVGKKLTGIEGFYINNVNYTLKLTAAPTIGEEVNGYPGYSSDNTNYPKPDHPGYGSENDNWHYNTYIPANFYSSNHNKEVEVDGVSVVQGFKTHNIQTDEDVELYFMNPKIQEIARIWGVWNETTQAFTVYETSWYNHYEPRISGAVSANWQYNVNGNVSNGLVTGNAYCFHAVVNKKTASPRFTANTPTASDNEPSSDYNIYPLDFVDAQTNYTALGELNFNVIKQVESVRYYNVMGMESKQPFEGINIVVTRYTDGTTSTMKVIR